jgi:hypothetical protein
LVNTLDASEGTSSYLNTLSRVEEPDWLFGNRSPPGLQQLNQTIIYFGWLGTEAHESTDALCRPYRRPTLGGTTLPQPDKQIAWKQRFV